MTPVKTILLIDDDEDDQEIFMAALQRKSGSVYFSGEINARTALEKLSRGQLQPDVIFLDLNMPIMNGVQFLKEIKNRDGLKDIPIVIYSTTSQQKYILQTLAMGASDFITKPDSLDDLCDILSKYIQ